MAWAERLPSGKYRGLYRDANGRKHPVRGADGKTLMFTHKPKAERAAAVAEEKARRNIWADPDAGRRTWGEWCAEWWPTRTVEPGTLTRDVSRRDVHLKPRWGAVPIGGITRQDVKAWCVQLRTNGLAPSTVEKCKALLSASLVAAMDAGIIDTNPAARIRLPKPPPAQEVYLTGLEVERVADECPTVFDRIVVETLAYTGLRFGELAGIHRDRVDWTRGLVRVVETFDEREGDIKGYPKGRRVRDVPVPGWLLEQWGTLPVVGAGCGVSHRAGRCRGPLLFTSPEGHVLRLSNWAEHFRTAVSAVGLDHVRVHDLRHTYASWLIQDGRSLAEVGKLLGHVSPLTTQRYAHLGDTDHEGVLRALAAPRLPQTGTAGTGAVVHLPRSNGVGPPGFEPGTRGLKARSPRVDES